MSKVEEVARAIYETEPYQISMQSEMPWADVHESQKEGFRVKARAALQAMPKTTESEAYWIAYAALSAVDAHRDRNGMKEATKAVMAQIEAFEAKRRQP
jgi:hypothetical protein